MKIKVISTLHSTSSTSTKKSNSSKNLFYRSLPKKKYFLPKKTAPVGFLSFSQKRFFSSRLEPLPVLDSLVEKTLTETQSLPLKNTAILLIQHTLPTYKQLIKAFLRLGAQKDSIFIAGKRYSECQSVADELQNELGVYYQKSSQQVGIGNFHYSFTRDINLLWQNALISIERKNACEKNEDNKITQIIVLDHGGYALAYIPAEALKKYSIVGVEKTTAGLINPATQGLPFPVIEVASCATKKILESPIIAEETIEKLIPLIPVADKKLTCGVISYGSIGKAIADKLLSMGHKVVVYDADLSKLQNTGNAIPTKELGALVAFADYIFGCTGRDITTQLDLFRLCNRDRTLISCSSEDKEFLSLLHFIRVKYNGKAPSNPLAEIEYINDSDCTIKILRGGFPVNFDNKSEIAPNKIQLTRSLVLAGVIQAAQFFKQKDIMSSGGNYMLDPKQQKFIAQEWLKYQKPNYFPQTIIDNFDFESWIREKSGGIYTSAANTPNVDTNPTLKQKEHFKPSI